MAINLKTVLDGNKGQQELSIILQNAKQLILNDMNAKRSNANLGFLEGKLNRIFYPVGVTSVSLDYYNNRMLTSTEEQLTTIFNNFNFEANKTGHHTAKVAIAPSTLKASMDSAAMTLKTLTKQIENTQSLTNKQYLEDLEKQVENLIQQGKMILETGERVMMFGGTQERIGGKDFDNALLIVNQLMAFSKALSIPDFVTPQEAGILFEEALALTNYVQDASNDVIDEELRQLALATSSFGSKSISRGQTGIVSYNISSDLINKNQAKEKGFKINKGNATYTYSYNPSAAKQGKMDVQLNYNSGNIEDFRVSAKRWSKGFGDLGETSIDAGISRMSGQSVAEAYKFAVLTPHTDWANKEIPSYIAANSAHDFAKFALKADIAMGLSQGITSNGAGYANILVVDTGSSIKVRDLATIVTDAKLSRYDLNKIESSANQIYNSMSNLSHGRTQSYLGLMTSTLNKMKVTINMSFNK